ncbi:MAG: vitamin K epoxide reductase family protein [Anaerolineae bacterium]|nr:vitamin K epoxide reductase family protein [Anaerolineae bacterium]
MRTESMLRKVWIVLGMAVVLCGLAWTAPQRVVGAKPVVRAVLFWAEGCSHCPVVLDKVLPPLQLKYGAQLQIAMIEVSGEHYEYFRKIEDAAQVPAERRGVPALFIGDRLLVGSQEIARELPGLIEKYLAAGGMDYPPLPGLAERLNDIACGSALSRPATPCPEPTASSPALASASVKLFAADAPSRTTTGTTSAVRGEAAPASQGFELATAVAVLLALSVVYALVATALISTGRPAPVLPAWTDVLIPIVSVLGLGVAGYLTFVETQNVQAVCGPVGDCNAVQASPYARLFGVVPVGLLGLLGYAAIVATWAAGRWGRGALARYAPAAMIALALFGVLFSFYLTYIELAVIRAVCIWCLTSAVLMALLLILAVRQFE